MNFPEAFESFLAGCEKLSREYNELHFPNTPPEKFSYTEGKRYIRVVRGGSAYCFVDRNNGDVLKAAGWKAPAKHARGNIFNADNGLGGVGPYGARYL